MKSYLTIDAGGTYLKSAVLDSKGSVFQDSVISVKSYSNRSKEKIFQAFHKVVTTGLEFIEKQGTELGGIGVAIPGPFDIKNAVSLMQHKFREIYGLNLRNFFYEIPGLSSDIPIRFIHDANAVLAGELWKGNAQGFANAAVITLGTGLGFAISHNGKVLCNEIGGPYLSIFKIPYKDGILEDYTAKSGFLKMYNELNGNTTINKTKVSDIGEWAENGDTTSILIFEKVGKILAESLKEIVNNYNIECLLFGGQISHSFHYMERSLKEGLEEINCLKKIEKVKYIENAAFWGTLRTILLNEK